MSTLFLASSEAHAQAPSRATVREMLSGFEDAPGAEAWRALGEETVPVLVALFDDASEAQPVRLRAVWAARFYATEGSRAFLSRVMANRSEGGIVVRTALESLAAAFGASAVPQLAPLLAHSDVAVREGAIRALGRVGGREARAALEARRGHERDEALVSLLSTTVAGLTH
jgi:HEAT repeat protein